jgi:hypothetical protein
VARKPYAPAPYAHQAPAYYEALKVIDIRWIDAGIPEEKLGPAFRVVLRNVGRPVPHKFDLLLTAGAGDKLHPEFPTAVETIDGLYPGQMLTIDMRLPIESLAMPYPGQEAPAPFDTVTVLTAAEKEVKPLAVVPRAEILPVDLVLAEMENYTLPAGAAMLLKGEGFAFEPGKVVLQTRGLNLAVEVLNWGPLGAEIKLPHLPLTRLTPARLFVVRNDGMVSRPLFIDLDVPVIEPVIEPAVAPASATTIAPATGPVDGKPVVDEPILQQPVIDEPAVQQPVEAATDEIEIPVAPLAPIEVEDFERAEDTPQVDAEATTAPSVAQSIASQLSRLLGR